MPQTAAHVALPPIQPPQLLLRRQKSARRLVTLTLSAMTLAVCTVTMAFAILYYLDASSPSYELGRCRSEQLDALMRESKEREMRMECEERERSALRCGSELGRKLQEKNMCY